MGGRCNEEVRLRLKECRRCDERSLEVIRESIVRRGRRSYLVCWYRCAACQDVSFGYRQFPEDSQSPSVVDTHRAEHEGPVAEHLPESDPRLSV
jgi:hypothetical protein